MNLLYNMYIMLDKEPLRLTLSPEEQKQLDNARDMLNGTDPKEALRGSINNFWCNLPSGSYRKMVAEGNLGNAVFPGSDGKTYEQFFADVDASIVSHGLDPEYLTSTVETLRDQGSLPEEEQERQFAQLLFPVFEDLAQQGYPVNSLKS